MSGFHLPRESKYANPATEVFATDRRIFLEKSAAFRRIDLHWCLTLEPSKVKPFDRKPDENVLDNSRMLADLEKSAVILESHLGSSLGLRVLGKAQAFRFFSYLFNLEEWSEQHQLRGDAGVDRQIVNSTVTWHSDHLQVGKRHVQMFSLKTTPEASRPCLFSRLFSLDCDSVLRIPGFVNRKYDPPQLVTVEYSSDATYRPDDFRLYVLRDRGHSAIVYDPACEFIQRFYDKNRGDIILNPLDARCPYWGPSEELRRRAEAKAIAASLYQPTTDKKGEFFTETPQKIFAHLLTFGPTPQELVDWINFWLWYVIAPPKNRNCLVCFLAVATTRGDCYPLSVSRPRAVALLRTILFRTTLFRYCECQDIAERSSAFPAKVSGYNFVVTRTLTQSDAVVRQQEVRLILLDSPHRATW